MSIKALVPANIQYLASAPTLPTLSAGDMYYDTTLPALRVYTGSTWVNANTGGSGGTAFTFAASPSVSPTLGDRWVDSATGKEYTYYNDGTSAQWVEVTAVAYAPLVTASPTFTGTVTMPTGTVTNAPIDFNAGVNLTTPVAGAFEYDGVVPYFTDSTTTGRGILTAPVFASNGLFGAPLRAVTTAQPLFGAFTSATGTVGTIAGTGPWTATLTAMTFTGGWKVGTSFTATAGAGSLGTGGTYVVTSIVSTSSITFSATGGTTPVAGAVTNILSGTTGALALNASTTYLIDGYIELILGATTTRTTSFGFGGTLATNTPNAIYYSTINQNSATGTTGTTANFTHFIIVAGGVINATASTSTIWFTIKGMIRTNLAATMIPHITFSAAPTGTPATSSIAPNTYFTVTPIGAASVTTVGAWA